MSEALWFLYGAFWSWILTDSWRTYREAQATRVLPPGGGDQ